MKTTPVVALFSLIVAAHSHRVGNVHKRQAVTPPVAAPAPPPPAAGTGGGLNVPPLGAINANQTAEPMLAPTTTYAPGATPPIAGAPPIPTPFVYVASQWPAPDLVPDTTSPDVLEWMKELEGVNIPNLSVTKDGSCENDTVAAADAANRGWWTCGGHLRSTDIHVCPDKLDWGLNYDDGPAESTPKLLRYLNQQKIHATFFVVGTKVVAFPNVLLDEYMNGHEISIHTWSHHALTSLTNEQIVAELGWTRKAIKTVLGVTPTTMRPPYGDIDDRVRAISLAMGLVPVIWTRTEAAGQFDTDDWQVASGLITSQESVSNFATLLGNGSAMDTGVIVLQHDIHQQTVDLAIGYYMPAVLANNPPFKMKGIGECLKWPAGNLYVETHQSKAANTSSPAVPAGSANAPSSTKSNSTPAPTGVSLSFAPLNALVPAVSTIFLAGLAVVAGSIV